MVPANNNIGAPSQKSTMVFDGDCSFCRVWIDYWKQLTGDTIEYHPYQVVAEKYPNIPVEHFRAAVHLVKPDGTSTRGANAVFESLASNPGKRWMLWIYNKIPGVPAAAEVCYRFIAGHRNAAFAITRLAWGKKIEASSGILTRWLFLRILGLIYLIAFASLGTQVAGLVGERGILPVGDFLRQVSENVGEGRYWLLPTLTWLNSSDAFLQVLCWSGAGLSLLLMFGIAQRLIAVLLWMLYLSLFYAGQTFLSFQWDILLLETGFLAIFYAPAMLLPRLSGERPPSPVIPWLFRLLLFRLMFFSGFLKLASGDTLWWKLKALTVHYETQPIPTPFSWYLHQLPLWVHWWSCALMFGIELGLPFLLFLPRRLRLIGCSAIMIFMMLIMISGNYTFFGLLTMAICIPLFDDSLVKRILPKRLSKNPVSAPARGRWGRLAIAIVAVAILFLNVFRWIELFNDEKLPAAVRPASRWASPFCIVNSYGLFRVMTNPRYEIIIERSEDGATWKEYEFNYKPGDVLRAPPWIEPHQPRLDWQMWFAVLGNYRQNQWFVNLCVRLLQGEPKVLALMGSQKELDRPPRYVRALFYEYHFTMADERSKTGAWWKRELKGLYLPPISLKAVQ